MTEKRALKQAIRQRMGETGEKYTEARRAILGRLEVDHRVFKRLTADAGRVAAMATDEARILKHSYVGTEHILLGLLREQNGVAAQALDALGITGQCARARVVRIVGFGEEVGLGQKPFTPRAIRVFELAIVEALLAREPVAPKHILLGLAREKESVGAQILLGLGAGAEQIRSRIGEVREPDKRERRGIEQKERAPSPADSLSMEAELFDYLAAIAIRELRS